MNREFIENIPVSGGIYRFTNIVNHKIYIGSAKNLRKRFVQHRSMLRTNCHHSIHFQNAYNKYGESSFIYDIIENVQDSSQLLIREQYYLDTLLFAQDYINKISNKFIELGYNINPIASSRLNSVQSVQAITNSVLNNKRVFSVLQFDFNGNQISEFISTGEASRKTGINRGCIYNCCKNLQEYSGNYFFIYKKDYNLYSEYFNSLKNNPFIPSIWNKGKSYTINKENKFIVFDRYGNFINTFKSELEISKFIQSTPQNISKSKNLKLIKNYYVFDLDYDYNLIIDSIKNKYSFLKELNNIPDHIMMYDVFDNFICGFNSVEEAARIMNINYNSIYCVLSNKRVQVRGFKFKYYDDIV